MRAIDSIEDQMRGVVTYELSDGRRVCMDARLVAEIGPSAILRHMGLGAMAPTKRLPVVFHSEIVGTMAPDFDPRRIVSKSVFYDPRPGDFRLEGDVWIAARTLGPRDIGSVVGFIPAQKGV